MSLIPKIDCKWKSIRFLWPFYFVVKYEPSVVPRTILLHKRNIIIYSCSKFTLIFFAFCYDFTYMQMMYIFYSFEYLNSPFTSHFFHIFVIVARLCIEFSWQILCKKILTNKKSNNNFVNLKLQTFKAMECQQNSKVSSTNCYEQAYR